MEFVELSELVLPLDKTALVVSVFLQSTPFVLGDTENMFFLQLKEPEGVSDSRIISSISPEYDCATLRHA